jgi:hypothetical protein
MRSAPILSLTAAVLLGLALVAPPAVAGDETDGATWTFRKGRATMEVTVTGLDEEERTALVQKYEKEGWTFVPRVAPMAGERVPGLDEDTLRDVEELLRGGGRLPEGFVPRRLLRGMEGGVLDGAADLEAVVQRMLRPVGRLVLAYLDAKADPVKGPVYEGFLREFATSLAKVGEPGHDAASIGARFLGKFLAGLSDPDPAKAAAYQEVMEILVGDFAAEGPAAGRPKTTVRLPASKPDLLLGGAPLRFEEDSAAPLVEVTEVPPGSQAAAVGLAAGDRILEIDGQAPTRASVARAVESFGKPGKLSFRVRRKDGSIEVFEIEFVKDEGR